MSNTAPLALIAEDEHLLAQALQAELARAWPELHIAGTVGDGASAVAQALALKPDVLFFDIRMPGMSGLEAAVELADAWEPDGAQGKPFPALVFITAYDQYAVEAFETQAIDYVLKPVQAPRLQKTVAKVQAVLARRDEAGQLAGQQGVPMGSPGSTPELEATLAQLRHLLAATGLQPGTGTAHTGNGNGNGNGHGNGSTPLKMIQASVGNAIRMVPVDEVLYFEAADKYVRVLTGKHEYLLRTPLKELTPQLDPQDFWQVHRGTVVRAAAIESVSRDEAGKLSLTLRGLPGKLAVSRLYAHLFKAM